MTLEENTMENSDIFFDYGEAQGYQTTWAMDEFLHLDSEVTPHPTPIIYYPYYNGDFERVTWLPVRCKSNKLRDVWAAIERAHVKSGDWHQFIEAIWPHDEEDRNGTYHVFLGS